MWIEKSGEKYRACEYYTDPLTGARHRAGVTIDKDTPQQRNKARAELAAIIARRLTATPDVMMLSELIDLYNAHQQATLKLSTCERNRRTCNTFLKILGDCDVNKLTAGIVKRQFMEYTDNPTTVNEYITRYKALMRWAYQNDFVKDVSYLDKLVKLKDQTKREKVKDKYLESEECTLLLSGMKNETWRNLTDFLLKSGLRIGEAIALDVEDIDFQTREIVVTKTYDSNNNIITTTKTLSSTRRVYMQDDLLSLTRSVVMSGRAERKILYLNHAPLFLGSDGLRASYDAYRKYLREMSVKMLGRVIKPHTLRHTHASLLAEQGIPLEMITSRLGHFDSRITKEIYVHVTEKRRQSENERLKKVALF